MAGNYKPFTETFFLSRIRMLVKTASGNTVDKPRFINLFIDFIEQFARHVKKLPSAQFYMKEDQWKTIVSFSDEIDREGSHISFSSANQTIFLNFLKCKNTGIELKKYVSFGEKPKLKKKRQKRLKDDHRFKKALSILYHNSKSDVKATVTCREHCKSFTDCDNLYYHVRAHHPETWADSSSDWSSHFEYS